ncbi:MAG TPA: LptF/LptG family permease [Phycisphaerae bacterium]|nr:LptF/LptG family permease [Phycisphaerae bacterium]
MLKTLHMFLSRELAKVTLLALVSFTLVMTIFAIVEPLRKQGLATGQVLALFVYTLPVMVSLTLPIAALFAATIVYGRVSQDNELTACRASGISTIALLRPAMLLGLLVTVVSLWLSNFVAPRLAKAGEVAVKANVRGVIAHQLRTNGYFKHAAIIVHADEVYPVDDSLVLRGAVLVDCKDPEDVRLGMAEQATLSFHTFENRAYASAAAKNPVGTSTAQYTIGRQHVLPVDAVELPNPIREDPAWYSWDRLIRVLRHPAENADIHRSLIELRRDLGYEMLAREVAMVIGSGQPYTRLASARNRCEITAPQAAQEGKIVELSSGLDPNGRRVPVRVRLTGERAVRTIEADSAKIEGGWSPRIHAPVASIELRGNVEIRVDELGGSATKPADEPIQTNREVVKVGDLKMPEHLLSAVEKVDPNAIVADVDAFSNSDAIRQRVRDLKEFDIAKLQGKVLAEMHGRVAYGASCFLLVAMGAAMGVLFRGGQIISAFALSVIPAAIVVVLLLMGKEMVANPGVAKPLGLAAIWGGIVALLIGNVLLYARLARR